MTEPQMHEVESSNVAAVGHDGSNLFVEFHNGGLYKYLDVPQTDFGQLLAASSVGRSLKTEIKPYYDYERLR